MESFLSLFIFHDSYVVSFLVLAITLIIVMLLLFNQKSPDSVIKSEIGDSEQVESALRRVLGEQRWSKKSSDTDGDDSERLNELEKEVLNKDRAIADLNKQLTQSGGGGDGSGEDNSLLTEKIAELESRLQEYEIIEDDIADLSLYRAENEKLKEELARLKALAGDTQSSVEEAPEVAEKDVPEQESNSAPATEVKKESKVSGVDLVAEFEKVVNSQGLVEDEPDGEVENQSVSDEDDSHDGSVVMAAEKVLDDKNEFQPEAPEVVHEKLKDIAPNSKEEAEILIADLKSLKKQASE